jgi:hypothetical protein
MFPPPFPGKRGMGVGEKLVEKFLWTSVTDLTMVGKLSTAF